MDIEAGHADRALDGVAHALGYTRKAALGQDGELVLAQARQHCCVAARTY